MIHRYRLLMMLAALGVASCGGKKSEAPLAAPAAETTPEAALLGTGEALSMDDATARSLPDDTAGALTIADLPGLIARLGLGNDADLVGALRDQLRDSLGIDLLDPTAARAAGLEVDQPVTLAWLDPEARHLALAVAIADEAKLEEALAGRPLLIRGDRALIPLGSTAEATRARLEAARPGHSLADSGVLEAVPALAVRGNVLLVFNPRAYPALAPATGVAVALRLEADATPTAVAARFGAAGPKDSRAWLGTVLARLGAELGVPLPSHRLALPLRTFVGSGEALTARLEAPLGVLALTRGGDDTTLTYYGAELSGSQAIIDAAAAIVRAHGEREQNAKAMAARQKALEEAAKAGTLGVLAAQQGGSFATLTGTADFSSGLDDADIYGGLLGNEVGEMKGGFGASGVGPGGGGTGWGTIGTGKYGTIGHGSGGSGSGYGTGSGRGGMRGRSAAAPQVRIGNPTVTGELDKNIIRRYIRRKLPQIKYCYEKQLLADPTLAGTVKVSFIISHTGQSGSATATGVHESVASCVARLIETIEFPKPKDGGIVQVEYPFVFRPGT